MGLFDSLFGSTQETIQPGAPQITQASTQTLEQEEFLKSLIANLQGATAGGGRVAPFQGDLTAAPSVLQQQGFESVGNLLGPQGVGSNLINEALQPFDPQATIDRFNQFQRPVALANQAESRRRLAESFAGTGGFDSGATLRAANRAETDFNLNLQSLLGNQLNLDQSRQENRQFQGLEGLLGIQAQTLGAGAQQRGIEQQGLSAILNEFIRSQGVDPLLGLAPTALGTQGFENIVQAPTTAFGQSAASQIAELLGGAGRLAGGIAAF